MPGVRTEMPEPESIAAPPPKQVADVFGVLVRLFFSRFFDKESLSPQGDPEANVIQTLGILAAPGAFISLLLFFNSNGVTGWNLVSARCLFLTLSMVVISFIVVFKWDALFLDRRDYQVLLPLPLPLWKLFLAKAAAFILFLGLFLTAINASATLFWPVVFDNGNYLGVVGAHLLVILAAGFFAAVGMACIQGLLLTLVPAKLFRPVATGAQTLLMTALVMLFFLSPLIGGSIHTLIGERGPLARYIPSFWFAGFYEELRPATHSHELLSLGKMALPALGCAVIVFALTHLPGYRRHARKLIEAPPSNPSGPGRLHTAINTAVNRLLVKDPTQQAVYHFIGQTISRSMKHRLFLATYAGFGAALVVISLGPDPAALLRIPLTLSFVLVSGLRATFNFPAELTANWAFQINGPDQTRQCLIAMRKWTIVCGVMPLFLLLTPLELAFFAWPLVLFQMMYGVSLSILLVELMLLDFQKIPFTCGYFPERSNLVWLIALYVGGLLLYSSSLADLEIRLMWEPREAVIFFFALLSVGLMFRKWQGRAQTENALDYLGDEDPVIRTLGIIPR